MPLTQVTWHLSEGIRALANFFTMLFEAGLACKVTVTRSADWDGIGINLDGMKYWIGVRFETPETLWFGTRCQINVEAVARLDVALLTKEKLNSSRFQWWRGVDLGSETIHFYSRSKVSQMRWLESFLSECLDMARSIETPDQPPIPDEPEES